jgi:hypothetical protein
MRRESSSRLFRLYAPTWALFDKAWTLPDVEEVIESPNGRASMRPLHFAFVANLLLATATYAQEATPTRVTVDNFTRAETDTYMAKFAGQGGFGKFQHERELASIDDQAVIRMNRDTLYSFAVFDLDAGPVTITLPDSGPRYMALQVIDEDHYAPHVFYAPGVHTLTKADIGTRYVACAVRTFVNPNDAADLQAVHALQDGIQVKQVSPGKFEPPAWDQPSLDAMRAALLAVVAAGGGLDSTHMFGRKDQVDPVQHLLGTAAGWGGNPRNAALYAGGSPPVEDGKTAYTLTVQSVPVDGFWSVSVYNAKGFFEKNASNAYTVNNVTAKPSADGSVTIHFGGDANAPNYLSIMPGWNYVVRMYRPRAEILDGSWKLPALEPVP